MSKLKYIFLIVLFCLTLCGCEKDEKHDISLLNYSYDYAMILMPDGTVLDVSVKAYWPGSSSVAIETTEGKVYAVHYEDVVFYNE